MHNMLLACGDRMNTISFILLGGKLEELNPIVQ